MSRLWPEHLVVGIAAPTAWLRRGAQLTTYAVEGTPPLEPMARIVAIFEAVLDTAAEIGRRGRVSLYLADPLAPVVDLPWQPHLRRPAEWRVYAEGRFEAIGLPVLPDWTLAADYRHGGRCGVAYAMPTTLLTALAAAATARGYALVEVLPAVVAAYFRHRPSRDGASLVVIEAPNHVAGLAYDRCGVVGMDIEPKAGAMPAWERALDRAQSRVTGVRRISHWVVGPLGDDAAEMARVQRLWPGVRYQRRALSDWRAP